MSGEYSNPFPGPQPYRAGDRRRFFGREEMTRKLLNRILAHPCVTLFGPSGAGKSSLMQAAVIPLLQELHGFRTVRVDAWLTTETPLERLVRAMFADLELGEVPTEMGPREALDEAVRLAERHSARPILIYVDQLEQLHLPSRSPEGTDELIERLDALARMPLRGLQLVLSLREDYLGRLRDRVRGLRPLQDPGFRLGPLTVREMARVACQLAEAGEPAQQWSAAELRALMLQMRTAGQAPTEEAEVQAAFAQIVCRALWEERVAGGGLAGPVEAEPILHRYLEVTLEALGPLRADALELLEDHLVARDGSRTLLTEQEARTALREGASEQVLLSLERAAVLHAEEHQGSRYFELGHDWLAKKVLELKHERMEHEEEARKHQQQERRQRRERSARRKLASIAAVATGVALLMCGLLLWVVKAKHEEKEQAERAFDQSVMAGAREQMELGQPAMATRLLLEARHPERLRGWSALSQDALDSNFLELTLHGSGLPLNAAAYSPDGQHIVTASEDGAVQLWQADGSGHPHSLGKHEESVLSAAFSPEGLRIVTASRDGAARVWQADGSREPIVLEVPREQIRSAAFSPDGESIVTASNTAWVWRVEDSEKRRVFTGHAKPLTSAAFSPDGKSIVTTSWDKTARVSRLDGSEKPRVFEGHEGPVTSAEFSPDGKSIVTASRDGTARLWRVEDSKQLRVFEEHEGPVQSAVFSPNGKSIVTASDDGTARLWRADDSGQSLVLKGHEGPVRSAAFSLNGKSIVTASWDGTVRVWRVDDSKQPSVLKGHRETVSSAAFSPDGKYIVTASRDKTARVWRADGSEEPRLLEGHEDPVTSAAFSPDGQSIVTASRDKTARVWRVDGSEKPRVLEGHRDTVSSAAFSPDGKSIVTASWDKTVWVRRADGSEKPRMLEGHEDAVTSAEFSPDGQSIVTASRDGTARVWRVEDSKQLRVFEEHQGPVTSAGFSPDGQSILTASRDGTMRKWRIDGSEETLVFKGHKGPVQSAAFSPDGEHVVTASIDRTVRVWRADDPKQFNVLKGHAGPVESARFSPDGQSIVTASWDGTARVWPLPRSGSPSIPDLQWQLTQTNGDCLDSDMRQDYLDENETQASEAHAACERSHRRLPAQAWARPSGSRTAGSPSRR
ncbi:eIF2A-related protein [Archangium lansingense]|uniref:nSTAND1 domain-containing NTPase n=1 Tax=Archangium lansingense TaxID=2995310 RepID=UPI003B777559